MVISNGRDTTKRATFICDLHVIENLPCDIILSNEFIFQNQVFYRFKDLFYAEHSATYLFDSDLDRGEDDGLLFIRNISRRTSWFSRR